LLLTWPSLRPATAQGGTGEDVLGERHCVMSFVHFPQRPDRLTPEFAAAEYEKLVQRSALGI